MIRHGCEPFFVRHGGAYSNLAEQYNAFCNKMQDANKSFCVTSQHLITTTHDPVLVVFYTYEQHEPATNVTQHLVSAPSLQPSGPDISQLRHIQYDSNGIPIIDAFHYNVNNRYEIAKQLAEHHGRSEMFSAQRTLNRAYFAGVSDTLDAQTDEAVFTNGG